MDSIGTAIGNDIGLAVISDSRKLKVVDTLPCDHGQSDVDLIDVAHPDLGNRAVDGTPVGALGQIAKTSRAAIVIAGRGETHVGALLEQRFSTARLPDIRQEWQLVLWCGVYVRAPQAQQQGGPESRTAMS